MGFGGGVITEILYLRTMNTKYDREIRKRSKLILSVNGNSITNHERKRVKK